MKKIGLQLSTIIAIFFIVPNCFAQNTCAAPTVIASLPYASGAKTTCGTVNNYAAGTLFNASYGGGEDYVFRVAITGAPCSATLTLGGAATYKIASVHSACPPTSANAIGGVITDAGSTGSATVTFPSNGTYYIIVDTWPTPACGAFTLDVSALTPIPPANDNCSSAIAMTVNANGSCTSTVTANSANATNSNVTPSGACTSNSGTPDDDIWYSFVAPATGGVILQGTYSSGSTDVYYQIFSSACGATMTSLLCTDTNTGGIVTGLTAGNTYYIRFYSWVSAVSSSYTLCLQATPPPPANDNCSGAIAMTVNAIGSCTTTTTANTAGATNSNVTPSGACSSNSGSPDEDIWYSFVAPASGGVVLQGTYISGNTDVYYQIFSSACGAAMTSVLCTDTDAGGTVSGLTAGSTYYLRFYSWSSSGTSSYTLCLQVAPPPPANDNCSGAIAMTVNANGSCAVTTTASTASATNSTVTPSGACTSSSGTPDDDVWYSFVAPASGGVILQGTYSSGNSDVYYQIFSSACGGTMTSLLCTDTDAGGTVSGLTPGAAYYLRFYSWYAGNISAYTLCLQATIPPAVGSNTGAADCASVSKLCTDGSILPFNTNAVGNTPVGNNYGCLSSTPRPNWFNIQIENPGDLTITVKGYDNTNTLVDIDFAVWGPYANLAAVQAACGTLPAPVDCNYSPSATEIMNIPVSTVGQIYVILVTGFSSLSDHFSLQQTTGGATTSCLGVAGACDIVNMTLANISACNSNATTPLATDDYFTADVTLTFANKPATGNLELVGTGIHSGTYATAVASIGTTTYTFTGVKIKADGSSQSITAQFSAQTGCNLIKSDIPAITSCSCAAGVMTLGVSTP